MEPNLRVVTTLPLRELWFADGTATSSRMEWLSADDIKRLLRAGPVRFVVANAGAPLDWIDNGDCYRFWKNELKQHLATSADRIFVDHFPGGYCYMASRWEGASFSEPVVLLEIHH